MPEDLPIYPQSTLRTRLQFADLDRMKGVDTTPAWEKSDRYIAQLEDAANVREARLAAKETTKAGLLQMHAALFGNREGAGQLRHAPAKPLYRGHDCPDPQFIEHSLNNFFYWLSAESVSEIHPIEKAALVLTRIIDIWPFEFGNLTVAIMSANIFLGQAGLAPFFVLPQHTKEFDTVIAQAMTIETQPLINAIYRTVKQEMDALAAR